MLDISRGDKKLLFAWEGADEVDEASGSGWLQLSSKDEVEGLIKFHGGDQSTFKARKAR
jgi:hypothetical protein